MSMPHTIKNLWARHNIKALSLASERMILFLFCFAKLKSLRPVYELYDLAQFMCKVRNLKRIAKKAFSKAPYRIGTTLRWIEC